MPDNWGAVGEAIVDRLAEIGMQQQELAAKSRVSSATIREIQQGKARRRHPRILTGLSKALKWPEDHLDNVLVGGKQAPPSQVAPVPDESPPPTQATPQVPQSDLEGMLVRILSILEHRLGRVVDVIYSSDSDIDVTIEIRHSPRP